MPPISEASLGGKVVLVTRPEPRDAPLVAALRARGAEAISAPVIRLEPSRRAAFARAIREAGEGRFEWVVFTSAATVDAWAQKGSLRNADSIRSRIAAIGEGTSAALVSRGIQPDLVPRDFTTTSLGKAFPRGSGEVLLPRADIAPAELEEALEKKGWRPVRVEAYRTRPVRSLPAPARAALEADRVDAITFTSASTVEGFLRVASLPPRAKVVCIGPVTASTAREAGLRVAAVARPHTIEGLVEAVGKAVGARAPSARSGRVRAFTRREVR